MSVNEPIKEKLILKRWFPINSKKHRITNHEVITDGKRRSNVMHDQSI